MLYFLGLKLRGVVHAAKNYQVVVEENRRLYNEVQELKGISCEIVFWKNIFDIFWNIILAQVFRNIWNFYVEDILLRC